MIKFVIFLSLVVFASGHTASESESSKQKRSIFEDVRILSPISSYGHGYPWTKGRSLVKISSEFPTLQARSLVSYGSPVRPPSPLVLTKHIIVEKPILVPGKPVIYEKQVPIHVPVHVPVERLVPVTVEKSVPVPVPQFLPYPVERQVPVRQNVPYAVPIIIAAQLAPASQPASQPQTLQLAAQQSPPPQILQFAAAPQHNPPPQIVQLAAAPQPTMATPSLSQLKASLARQPSDSRSSILPISFSVNAGISAGVQNAPQPQDLSNIDLSSLAQLNLLQAPPSSQPLQSNSLESLWGPEEYNDHYTK